MALLQSICLLGYIIGLAISDRVNNDNLIAVVQLFRHGQRVPNGFYPNDPYSDTFYWKGLTVGELTRVGGHQQYALGKETRHRYRDWLPETYSHKDFRAQTTNVSRNRLSAVFNVAGLYQSYFYHPKIPIHTVNSDILRVLPEYSCTNFYIERSNFLASNESLTIDKNFGDIFSYLTVNSGENITSFAEINLIVDPLSIEEEIGLPLPTWTKKVYPEPLTYLTGLYFDSFSRTTKMQRLSIGVFLNELLEYFEAMADIPTSSQKFLMYSAHDINIATILSAFDAFNPPFYPDFASSIYFELRCTKGTHYVNVWLKNKGNLQQVSIRGCELDCPLLDVNVKLAGIRMDIPSRKAECKENTSFVSELAEEKYNKFFNDVLI